MIHSPLEITPQGLGPKIIETGDCMYPRNELRHNVSDTPISKNEEEVKYSLIFTICFLLFLRANLNLFIFFHENVPPGKTANLTRPSDHEFPQLAVQFQEREESEARRIAGRIEFAAEIEIREGSSSSDDVLAVVFVFEVFLPQQTAAFFYLESE